MNIEHYAVIGQPVSHSLSPEIHSAFAKQYGIALRYIKINTDVDHFESQVSTFFNEGGKGLNVTMPFKQRAYAMAVSPSQRVKMAKAANTLWMHQNQLQAENSDGDGLITDLLRYTPIAAQRILIIGAGGAARGLISPLLEKQPAALVLTNRSMDKAEALKTDFPVLNVAPLDTLDDHFDLLINATSMSFDSNEIHLPDRIFSTQSFCYDLVYHLSGKTGFVNYARKHGCQAVDGLGMLVEQAAISFDIWHGVKPDTLSVLKKLRNLSGQAPARRR